jgi:hypothetical protein
MKGLIEAATEMRLLWVTTMDVNVTIIEEDKVETQVKCSQRVPFTKVCNYSIDLYSLTLIADNPTYIQFFVLCSIL